MQWQSGEAKWRQIERRLSEEIAAGVFPPGEKLPTELELARRFEVNRHTVRQAIAALVDAHAIRVEQGRGTFVQENILDYTLSNRTRFSQNVSRRQKLPHKQMLEAEEVKGGSHVAAALHLKKGSKLIRLFSVSEADGVPVAASESFLPAQRFSGIVGIFSETGSLTEALRRFGIEDYQRRETKVTAQLPTTRIAALLRQPRNRPVVVTENVDVDMDGTPIEFGTTWFASDRVQLIVEGR